MNALVCSHPDVVVVTLSHAFHGHVGCRDEQRLVVLRVVGVEAHLVETDAVKRCQHVATAGDDKRILCTQIVMSADAL